MLPTEAPTYQFPKTRPRWNDAAYSSVLSPDRKLVAFITRFVTAETESNPPIFRGQALSLWAPDGAIGLRHVFKSDDLTTSEPLVWTIDSQRVLFLERSLDSSSIYALSVANGEVRRVYDTPDFLSHIAWNASRNTIVAVSEQPAVPPALVRIDLNSGKRIILARPNAYFDEIALPESHLLRITNSFGHRMAVRVTMPNGYVKGRRYPLVATTYTSNNSFQRGAVGDEYPIYVTITKCQACHYASVVATAGYRSDSRSSVVFVTQECRSTCGNAGLSKRRSYKACSLE